jgi:hypothetical protein
MLGGRCSSARRLSHNLYRKLPDLPIFVYRSESLLWCIRYLTSCETGEGRELRRPAAADRPRQPSCYRRRDQFSGAAFCTPCIGRLAFAARAASASEVVDPTAAEVASPPSDLTRAADRFTLPPDVRIFRFQDWNPAILIKTVCSPGITLTLEGVLPPKCSSTVISAPAGVDDSASSVMAPELADAIVGPSSKP